MDLYFIFDWRLAEASPAGWAKPNEMQVEFTDTVRLDTAWTLEIAINSISLRISDADLDRYKYIYMPYVINGVVIDRLSAVFPVIN